MNEVLQYILLIVIALLVLTTVAASLIWLERRMLALFQDRYGPNRAGPFGLFIVLADTLKLFFKQDWIPAFADRRVFVLAPAILVIPARMGWGRTPPVPARPCGAT